jgi:hypothetical protein
MAKKLGVLSNLLVHYLGEIARKTAISPIDHYIFKSILV